MPIPENKPQNAPGKSNYIGDRDALVRHLMALPQPVHVAQPQGTIETTASLNTEAIRSIITRAGGTFIGAPELMQLGQLPEGTEILPVPSCVSSEFLGAEHPIRGDLIATHIILGYDPETREWYCVEKSAVPNSFGLTGHEQDSLLLDADGAPLIVEGLPYESPRTFDAIHRVINNAIKLNQLQGGDIESGPFCRYWARTAYSEKPGSARYMLGDLWALGTAITFIYPTDFRASDVGLMASWKLRS